MTYKHLYICALNILLEMNSLQIRVCCSDFTLWTRASRLLKHHNCNMTVYHLLILAFIASIMNISVQVYKYKNINACFKQIL